MSYLCVTSVFFFLFFFLSYSNHSLYVLADASDVLVCYVSDWIAVIIWSGPRRLGGKEKWWGWSVLRREEAKFTSSYISVHCTTPKNAAVRWAKTLWIKGEKKKTPVGKMGWGDKCIVWGWKAGELFTCQKSQDNTGKCILRPDECKNIQWFLNDRLSRSLWKRNQSKADLGYLLIKFD